MRKWLMLGCVFVASVVHAAPYVTNVVAQQRYPWNGKVDISFEVVGDPAADVPDGKVVELSVEMTNKATGKKYAATNLTGDIEPSEGKHNVVWDMTEQGVDVYAPTAVFTVAYLMNDPLYRVVDVSSGSDAGQYTVSSLNAVPDGGWSDEYKTDKIVLRRIDGTNGVYYAGVFEVTEAQWAKVMGGTSTSMKPKGYVSYNDIRGDASVYDWPMTDKVASTSFIGKLRQKTGLATLDLPTEAEWKFAARAGVTTKWLCGDSETELGDYAWYSANSGNSRHDVGTLKPNAWGLYDVHGNVWELCLDLRWSDDSYRVIYGGAYDEIASNCAFTDKTSCDPSSGWAARGFRLFCRPESN